MDDDPAGASPATGRRRRATGGPPAWFGIPFAVLGVVAVVLGIGNLRQEQRFATDGLTAQAVVTGKTHSIGTGDDADTYGLRYSFVESGGGATVSGSASVNSSTYEAASEGDALSISYLSSDPSVNRLGNPQPQLGAPLAIIGVGALFTLVGVGLLFTSIRARGARVGSVGGQMRAVAGPLEVERFTRSPMRVVVDLVAAPVGGVAFLGMAWFAGTNVGTYGLGGIVGAALAGFFGVIVLLGAAVTVRRGVRLKVAEIGPDGIWTPELGRLGWSDVAEVRLEVARGIGGRRHSSTAEYARIGIVPRDPALVTRAPGRALTGLLRGFIGMLNQIRPGSNLSDPSLMAPYGIQAYEIEQPFEQLTRSIQRYVPVAGATAADASQVVAPAPSPIAGVLGGLGIPMGSFVATRESPELPAARTFERRGISLRPLEGGTSLIGGLLPPAARIAIDAGVAVLFAVVPVAIALTVGLGILGTGSLVGLPIILVGLAFAGFGLASLLGVSNRWRMSTGDPDLLTVDQNGIEMRGMGRLAWNEIDDVRAVDQGGSDDDSAGSARLEIVPREPARLAERPWSDRARDGLSARLRSLLPFGDRTPRVGAFRMDLGLLDANSDEVLDLIARYRVVDDET